MIKCMISTSIVSLLVIGGLIGFCLTISENMDAQGPTYISGILTENTTWSFENSPYIVQNNVLVEENINLTIQPGVAVKFDNEKYLRIDGTLFAIGSKEGMITFTSNKTSPSPGDWGGIRFKDTCRGSILNYCIIKYGGGDIYGGGINNEAEDLQLRYSKIENNSVTRMGGGILNRGKITIEQSMIYNNFAESLGGGINNDDYGILVINNSKIISNNSTYYGGGIYNDYLATTNISNSIISNNIAYDDSRHGGGIFNYGSLKVSYCNIYNNNATENGGGISNAGSANIENCQIYGNTAINGGGIHYGGRYIEIRNSDITNNIATFGGGIHVDRASHTKVNYCNIDNLNYNIYLKDSPYDVEAKNNWWKTTDADLINLSIHDYYDDFDLGKVIYQPFQSFSNNNSNQIPNKPTIPNGSIFGATNTSYTYSIYAFDPDDDKIKYGWDWDGDGMIEEWSYLLDSGTEDNRSHSWPFADVFYIRAKVQDEYGAESDWSDPLAVTITDPPNNPPTTPAIPSGPGSGTINTSYIFSTSTIDPENHQIKYGWDWNGDGIVDEWSILNESGVPDNRQHMWFIAGSYNVTVIAEDEYGAQSERSTPIVVIITEENIEPDTNGKDDTKSDNDSFNLSNIIIFILIIIIVVLIGIILFLLKKT